MIEVDLVTEQWLCHGIDKDENSFSLCHQSLKTNPIPFLLLHCKSELCRQNFCGFIYIYL